MKYLFLLLLGFMTLPVSADRFLFQLEAKNKYERSEIANMGFAPENITSTTVDVFGSQNDFARLKKTGRLISSVNLTQTGPLDYPIHDEMFHNYDELEELLLELESNHPEIIKVNRIGPSVEGRDLFHVVLTEDPNGDLESKPAVIMMGGHHAREHLSVELPLGIIKYIVEGYQNRDSEILRLLSNRILHVIPIVNPDGAEYDISNDFYKHWRKNRKENREGSFGVDLNRNYDHEWGTVGTSHSHQSDVYCGSEPFSEPESQAVKELVESYDNISILLSIHTYSELILYPWGHTYDPISDSRDRETHEVMAETMAEWNGYKPQQSSDLYKTSGDTSDWAYGKMGIFSFTFELDPASGREGGFYPGQSYIQPIIDKNIQPVLYLLDLADNPYRAIDPIHSKYGIHKDLLM